MLTGIHSFATIQVEFYEIAKKLSGNAGWGLLDFLLEYKGVALMPVLKKDGLRKSESKMTPMAYQPVQIQKELLILQNLYDGKKKPRLLDIKIGPYTSDLNRRSRLTFAAYKQCMIDSKTNSAKEGYHLERFDGCPTELMTFNPHEESAIIRKSTSEKKAMRMQLQDMPAERFLSWFIDCREAMGAPGYDYATHTSNAEYGESVLRAIVVKLAALAKALREVPVPQKWLGSSIALLFEAGELPERGAGLEAAAREAGVYLFDWGSSTLLSKEAFDMLPAPEQEDRKQFWNYYSDGVCRLFYEALRAYYHRFCSPAWTHVLIEIVDYDSISAHDLAGKVEIPLEETGGPKEFKLFGADGKPVRKKGKDCNLKVTISKRPASSSASAVPSAWLVTVHSADQIPNMDKVGPAWGLNFTGSKSDGYAFVTALVRGSRTRRSACGILHTAAAANGRLAAQPSMTGHACFPAATEQRAYGPRCHACRRPRGAALASGQAGVQQQIWHACRLRSWVRALAGGPCGRGQCKGEGEQPHQEGRS